jgi:hypothetical protein
MDTQQISQLCREYDLAYVKTSYDVRSYSKNEGLSLTLPCAEVVCGQHIQDKK